MLIISELTELKRILLNKLSLKEQVFYQFLVGEPLSYPMNGALTEIEQIYYSVFCTDIPPGKDVTSLIEAQRRTRPIGGMHYTQNLIELSAIALANPELEKDTLKAYSESHSTRDFYILQDLFSDIDFNTPTIHGTIDEIASHLYKKSFPEEWKTLLLMGLKEASDLIDLYVIEQWYKQAMDNNPIIHRTNDILYARDILIQIVAKTERRVKLVIRIFSVLLAAPTSYWLVSLIIRNWDEIEPIMAIIELLGSLISTLIVIFVGFIPDRIKFLNSLREKIIDWVFRRKGLNRLELKETLDRLADQDEI